MGNASSQPTPYSHTKTGAGHDQERRSVPTSPSRQASTQLEKRRPEKRARDTTKAMASKPEHSTEQHEGSVLDQSSQNGKFKKPKARKTGRMRPPFASEEPTQSSESIRDLPNVEKTPIRRAESAVSEELGTLSQVVEKQSRKRRRDQMRLDDDDVQLRNGKRSKVNASSVGLTDPAEDDVVPGISSNGKKRARKAAPRKSGEDFQHNGSTKRVRSNTKRNGVRKETTPSGSATTPLHATTSIEVPIHVMWDGPSTGKFSEEEVQMADAVFERFRRREGKGDYEMRAMIEDWANVVEFKAEIEEILPNRNKAAIRKFCKRRFTTRNRGQWTETEDRELLEAYQKYPGSWNQIADFVNRGPDNCRSRYNNHLQYGSNKKTGAWSREEESKLVAIVRSCLKAIADAQDESSESKPKDLISFAVVAQKMTNRSEQRCRSKWRQLVAQGHVEVEDGFEVSFDPAETLGSSGTRTDASRLPVVVRQQIDTFEDGDFYDVLTEIHSTFKDPNQVWRDESTMWSQMALVNSKSKFALRKLRRAAYLAALERFDPDEKVTKMAPTVAAKAARLAREIARISQESGTPMSRAYDPQTWAARSASISESRRSLKSPEIVVNSDATSSSAPSGDDAAEMESEEEVPAHSGIQKQSRIKKEPVEDDNGFDDGDGSNDVWSQDQEQVDAKPQISKLSLRPLHANLDADGGKSDADDDNENDNNDDDDDDEDDDDETSSEDPSSDSDES